MAQIYTQTSPFAHRVGKGAGSTCLKRVPALGHGTLRLRAAGAGSGAQSEPNGGTSNRGGEAGTSGSHGAAQVGEHWPPAVHAAGLRSGGNAWEHGASTVFNIYNLLHVHACLATCLQTANATLPRACIHVKPFFPLCLLSYSCVQLIRNHRLHHHNRG